MRRSSASIVEKGDTLFHRARFATEQRCKAPQQYIQSQSVSSRHALIIAGATFETAPQYSSQPHSNSSANCPTGYQFHIRARNNRHKGIDLRCSAPKFTRQRMA